MTKKELIKKDDLIGDIIKENPLLTEIMLDHGIQFLGRHIALRQILKQASSESKVNVNNLLDELNYKTGE